MSQIHLTTHYLQMFDPPESASVAVPEGAMVMQANQPTVSFYRYLYNHVGEEWLWYERRRMSDEDVRAIIHNPPVCIMKGNARPCQIAPSRSMMQLSQRLWQTKM